jgi:hypothetical protein
VIFQSSRSVPMGLIMIKRPDAFIGSGITFHSGGVCQKIPHKMQHMPSLEVTLQTSYYGSVQSKSWPGHWLS